LSSRVLLGADKVIWLVSGGGGVDILAQVTKPTAKSLFWILDMAQVPLSL